MNDRAPRFDWWLAAIAIAAALVLWVMIRS